jgi:DNA mismatch repair protein MutL
LIPEFGKEEVKEQKLLDIQHITGPDLLEEIVPVIESGRQINIEEFPGKTEVDIVKAPEYPGEKTQLPKISLIGQILYTYIVAQSGDELLLIDQHAAHERVLFDRLMGSEKEGKREQQELLSPMTLELTPKQMNFMTQNLELLSSMGFEIEPFGGNTFQVRAVPVVLREIIDSKTLHDIIDELVDVGKTKHEEEIREKAMAIVACHSAIRAGEELSRIEMKSLMESLYATENPYSCPHGRPSIMSISKGEIEKRFKRKV